MRSQTITLSAMPSVVRCGLYSLMMKCGAYPTTVSGVIFTQGFSHVR